MPSQKKKESPIELVELNVKVLNTQSRREYNEARKNSWYMPLYNMVLANDT